jgi:hypothetical protein
MSLAEIKDQVDTVSETWRDGTAVERRAELVELDGALADLDDVETDTQVAMEAVDELRGRIEVLMDEIEISLGVEPEPIDVPEESELESERGLQ